MTFRKPNSCETLSSFLTAWRVHQGVSRTAFDEAVCRRDPSVSVALSVDPDFPHHPSWQKVLSEATGIPLDDFVNFRDEYGAWPLFPAARHCACLACLRMADTTNEQYGDVFWTRSTVTTCFCHGYPLVTVPAIGCGWADLPAKIRRERDTLMLQPELSQELILLQWSQIDKAIRDAIYFAEISLWTSGVDERVFSAFLRHSDPSPDLEVRTFHARSVWQDLLTLLCCSWSEETSPAVAVEGLPVMIRLDQKPLLRCSNRPTLLRPPTIELFRSIGDPELRRACILVAMDAIHPNYLIERRKPDGLLEGWRYVIVRMPESAWQWLERQSKMWSTEWQESFTSWADFRETYFKRWPITRRRVLHGALYQ